MVASPERFTPTYLKPMHRGYEGVEVEGPRFDIENYSYMGEELENRVIENLRECVPLVDGVIVGDQMPRDNQGVVTDRVREDIIRLAGEYPDKFFYADSRTRIGLYRDIIIKPNRFEAKRALEPDWTGEEVNLDEARQCGEQLIKRTGKPVYVTVGENGIFVVTEDAFHHVPGIRITSEIDPVGAGDSVSAGMVSTLCAGGSYLEAAIIGNLVASITVTKIGATGTASHEEIIRRFKEINLTN